MTDAEVRSAPQRRRYLAGFGVLGIVTLLGFAAPLLPAAVFEGLTPWLHAARDLFWAPLAGIAAFVVLATIGTPQIVLVTALVAVFGPWAGFAYSWVGKVIACSVGFFVGRRFGARWVVQRMTPRVAEVMAMLARRGFLASALIRLVPTVPSVLINIAAGVTPIRFRDFIAGTAIGSVPKLALLAFGGHAAMVAVQDNALWAWGALALTIALWFSLAYLGRRWLQQKRGEGPAAEP